MDMSEIREPPKKTNNHHFPPKNQQFLMVIYRDVPYFLKATPWKITMIPCSPKNHPIEHLNHLPNHHFQALYLKATPQKN